MDVINDIVDEIEIDDLGRQAEDLDMEVDALADRHNHEITEMIARHAVEIATFRAKAVKLRDRIREIQKSRRK